MSTFIGEYACKADNKSRIVVPSSFRKEMEGDQVIFVLRKNVFERCIDMYPIAEWEKMMDELKGKLNRFNAKHMAFLREFCRGTLEVEMDANGRILLPRKMLEEVGIEKEMVLSAQDSVIQIWDIMHYERVALNPVELEQLASEILG